MRATRSRLPAVLLLGGLTLFACGIAETKLPPDPTVEYLPCFGMDLDPAQRVDPLAVLVGLTPDLEESFWGGTWKVGDESHIGLTDVGAVDWQTACPQLDDPGLVVHEVPFALGALETWSREVEETIDTTGDPGSMFQEIIVISGQYVIEIRAESVEEAAVLAEGIPIEAWAYGGPVSLGSE